MYYPDNDINTLYCIFSNTIMNTFTFNICLFTYKYGLFMCEDMGIL